MQDEFRRLHDCLLFIRFFNFIDISRSNHLDMRLIFPFSIAIKFTSSSYSSTTKLEGPRPKKGGIIVMTRQCPRGASAQVSRLFIFLRISVVTANFELYTFIFYLHSFTFIANSFQSKTHKHLANNPIDPPVHVSE